MADTRNAYLQSPTSQKHYIICGPEFGMENVDKAIIRIHWTPDHYLGSKVRKVQLENGVYAWAFSSSQYVQTAVKNVEAYLLSENSKCWKMPNMADTPLTTTYRPELDVSRELNDSDAAYYLRWIIELG